jgi:hypothetical protein
MKALRKCFTSAGLKARPDRLVSTWQVTTTCARASRTARRATTFWEGRFGRNCPRPSKRVVCSTSLKKRRSRPSRNAAKGETAERKLARTNPPKRSA